MVRGSGSEMNFQLGESKAADLLEKDYNVALKEERIKGKQKRKNMKEKLFFTIISKSYLASFLNR